MAISWGAALGSMDDSLESLMARRRLENNGLLQIAQTQDQFKTSQMNRDTLTEQRQSMADFRRSLGEKAAEETKLKQTAAEKANQEYESLKAVALDPDAEAKYGAQVAQAAKLQYYAGVKPSVNLTEKDANDAGTYVVDVRHPGKATKLDVPKGAKVINQGYAPAGGTTIQFTPGMIAGAQRLVETGAMPMTINRGNAGLMGPVLENVGKSGTVDSVGVNRAAYQADAKALKDIQSTVDNMEGFKRATVANGQNLKNLLGKLPDSGVPWLNVPLRQLNKNIVGAQYATAIEAARQIHAREVARITNNPRLVGNLTDSAQAHVSEMLNVDQATIPQILAAMDYMQRDMDNVTREMKGQIETIKGRMTHPGGSGGAGAAPGQGEQAAPAAAAPAGPLSYQDYLKSKGKK